ncbi:putative mitotic checkpoint protein prcc [Phaeomoniella chlamydospora]|uniref:Putative mitotic checkpoint protein prcc n=1 Tax=Phaeomoniella chlamydospora TaxID=158046 RepID=A0A0G2GB24_PHACM|nr:putative mitotic checkpoint protein prcc [Phaeomoniella chlamydospora]
MALVSYSDSEGSDDEQPQVSAKKAAIPPPTTTKSGFNAIVEKSNPRKIRVNLSEKLETNGGKDGEPAPKKPRIGGGAFSGFNAMLPAPKRTAPASATPSTAAKGAPRKVFSLKTGAEPGFDRQADEELREMFAEQEADRQKNKNGDSHGMEGPHATATSSRTSPPTSDVPPKPQVGTPMMFKPLSVARGPQRKRKSPLPTSPATSVASPADHERSSAPSPSPAISLAVPPPAPTPPKPKVSLFSMNSGVDSSLPITDTTSQAEYEPLVYTTSETTTTEEPTPSSLPSTKSRQSQPQTLQSIATDLNLTPSQQRQLFGRQSKNPTSSNAANIINFNTDAEYAANEALRASGEAEANQHRNVKAIAPGKHSLKQLINNASGQAEALEESFAQGRRNKMEAGSKYGW